MKSILPGAKLSLLLAALLLVVAGLLISPALPQTRERTVSPNRTEANIKVADIIKTDVDLVTIDALVLQKNTARVVGSLKQEDFLISEDGSKQTITHFSQDTLPLSVLLLIDRGGCLDPFGENVRRAANDALSQLKPSDEVAVMTYHDTAELRQGFTHDRILLERAINYVPPHDERANHCLNIAFDDAANYMMKAGNPSGRRVIVARVVWRKGVKAGLQSEERVPIEEIVSLAQSPGLQLTPRGRPAYERRRRPRTNRNSRLRARALEFASVAIIGASLAGAAFGLIEQALGRPFAAAQSAPVVSR